MSPYLFIRPSYLILDNDPHSLSFLDITASLALMIVLLFSRGACAFVDIAAGISIIVVFFRLSAFSVLSVLNILGCASFLIGDGSNALHHGVELCENMK
jgi:hypothetical protein